MVGNKVLHAIVASFALVVCIVYLTLGFGPLMLELQRKLHFQFQIMHRDFNQTQHAGDPLDGVFPIEILKLTRSTPPEVSFRQTMKLFPWRAFQTSLLAKNTTEIDMYSKVLEDVLVSYVKATPKLPANSSCGPPPVFLPKNCTRLPYSRRVGVLLQFGFDVDALEIHLHEISDLVDKVFLIESISTNSRRFSWRPLLWDRLKRSPVFEQFSEKVIHFLVDDAELSHTYKPRCKNVNASYQCRFEHEVAQERLRWKKFVQWNSATNYFGNEDILGFGDTDEIPWRGNVFALKHCQMPSDPVDIGIWFPMDGTDSFFASDFPVKGQIYTYGDPTYWTLKAATRATEFPNRNRGRSQGHLLGGLHFSMYKYPPFRMLKKITASDCSDNAIADVIGIGIKYTEGSGDAAERLLWELQPDWKKRTRSYDQLKGKVNIDEIRKMPWYLDCNKKRFPYFFGHSGDSRLTGRE